MDYLNYLIYDVPLIDWLTVLGIGLGIAVIMMIVRKAVVGRFERLASSTANIIDDVIAVVLKNTKRFTFFALGIWIATLFRQLPGNISEMVGRFLFLVLLFQIGIWGTSVIDWWINYYREKKLEQDPSAVTTISAIGMLARIGLWSMLLLAVLDNFGIDVTALVTGLGIGGIAVALAVQNILGDIFASLSIVLDKPFVVGDFLVMDDYKGNVEYIGLKTTRIRSLSGEQIIVSNSDLLKSRLRNFKRMYKRRVVFSIGVDYSTPRSTLEKIPGMIRGCLEKHDDVTVDRSHFSSFGDSALIFEAVYHVGKPDYGLHMDIQQTVNLELMELFEAAGIGIAYPTQKVFVEMEGGAKNE
ncbi:MAG: mechanosensitive ion channel family protein [Rhodothermales bacterium]